MPFTKIKYAKHEVALQWKDEAPRSTITHELTCSEEPRPEFLAALADFATLVLDLCELDSPWKREMTIQSVSISESDLGRGIVVTALKRLTQANSPLVINTPFLAEEASSDAGPCLPHYAVTMLDRLEEEAGKYRAGERAQTDLFKKAS